MGFPIPPGHVTINPSGISTKRYGFKETFSCKAGMSFWANSPGPHWSDCIWSSLLCLGTPNAFPLRTAKLREPALQPTVGEIYIANEEDAEEICMFLHKYFCITSKCECSLSPEDLRAGLRSGWITIFTRGQDGLLSGTITSRPLGTCMFQFHSKGEFRRSKCPNTDYIDFFCVREDYKHSGIGSELLKWIDYYCVQCNRFVHFFKKEIQPLRSLPPLWQGQYIVRELQTGDSNPDVKKIHHRKLPAELQDAFSILFTHEPTKSLANTTIYKYDCRNFCLYVAITNAFHKGTTGGTVGEVLFYRLGPTDQPVSKKSIAAGIETILENSGYRYILMDQTIPHQEIRGWRVDAPYYIYCYNLNPRKFFTCRPEFLL